MDAAESEGATGRGGASELLEPLSGPPFWARILADRFGAGRVLALILVAAPGWAIATKLHQDRAVPPLLYGYLLVGLALSLVFYAARYVSGDVARAMQFYEARHEGRLDDEAEDQRPGALREYLESIVIAVCIAFFLRAFVVEAFKIPSGSMIPTLQVGDHIFVNKFIYGLRIPWTDIKLGMGLRKPERGEVVVFKWPRDPEKDFIKRVIAVGGDTVEIRGGAPIVNGVPIAREHVSSSVPCEYEDFEELPQRWQHRLCDAWRETQNGRTYTTYFDRGSLPRSSPKVLVPPGTLFVMGDNRDNSLDSRFWGVVRLELLRGKAMVVWWSLGEPEGIRVNRIGQSID